MASIKDISISIIVTFIIGLVAGIAPFLFMQLLPSMLNPNTTILTLNYHAIIVTGILIGAITSIIFSKSFLQKEPQDIFFYALGIPAILIATVSNISTQYTAEDKINNATQQVLASTIKATDVQDRLQDQSAPELMKQPPQDPTVGLFSSQKAWAHDSLGNNAITLASANNYLLVIGEYCNHGEAWSAYKRFRHEKLRSERYVPKNLQVLKFNNNYYVLVYSRHSSNEEANRVYKVLKINDPQLYVKILRY